MKDYFRQCGDCCPNRDGEIHIEPMCKTQIYKEYQLDSSDNWSGLVSEEVFNALWIRVYYHVKIRANKDVAMTCMDCSVLSYARRKSKVPKVREEITALHALHR